MRHYVQRSAALASQSLPQVAHYESLSLEPKPTYRSDQRAALSNQPKSSPRTPPLSCTVRTDAHSTGSFASILPGSQTTCVSACPNVFLYSQERALSLSLPLPPWCCIRHRIRFSYSASIQPGHRFETLTAQRGGTAHAATNAAIQNRSDASAKAPG